MQRPERAPLSIAHQMETFPTIMLHHATNTALGLQQYIKNARLLGNREQTERKRIKKSIFSVHNTINLSLKFGTQSLLIYRP